MCGGLWARETEDDSANMDGAVYISFFQGQLESVLEQVVQLAVQEISKTVGSSLSALLLETAVKEQENHRLRLQLQLREERDRAVDGSAKGTERADSVRTKAQRQHQQQHQQPPELHASGGLSTESGRPNDTRRLEHRGRLVDQLKSVMEKVLDFAICELTKIVEASYDHLLLKVTTMEHERRNLEERLGRRDQGSGAWRRCSEHDSVSPSGSDETRDEVGDAAVSKKQLADPNPPCVQYNPQDWVPILDKVFGEKWSDDSWSVEEKGESGRGPKDTRTPQHPKSLPLSLESATYSPQQDPRWTPLEDLEVFSPDMENRRPNSTGVVNTAGAQQTGPLPSSSGSGHQSSASMLQRLLTLPSQLLEEDATKETLVPLAMNLSIEPPGSALPHLLNTGEVEEDMEDGEEGEEEDKGKKRKRRRVWSECGDCGRRFSRVSQLKSHRLTHAAATDWVPSPLAPPSGNPPLQCSKCGKRFSSATRLESHVTTVHPGEEALT